MLPSELVLFENEEMENLFYAKMYENSLLTYEIAGKNQKEQDKKEIEYKKGPVVACVDTSGSMAGVLLFGARGQILKFKMENESKVIELLRFLNQGFNGGTDFNTPLREAIKIIESKRNYNKADILFITDGLCNLNNTSTKIIQERKKKLNFQIFTVNCQGCVGYMKDGFSDEIIGI